MFLFFVSFVNENKKIAPFCKYREYSSAAEETILALPAEPSIDNIWAL